MRLWIERWNVGEYARWHKRLVKVTKLDRSGCPKIIEFVDAGGTVHTYYLRSPYGLRRFSDDQNTVLDLITAEIDTKLSPEDRPAHEAEIWLAGPQPGDVFIKHVGCYLRVKEICGDGSIPIEYSTYSPKLGRFTKKTVVFRSADHLRSSFRATERPGYTLRAHSSNRKREEVAT